MNQKDPKTQIDEALDRLLNGHQDEEIIHYNADALAYLCIEVAHEHFKSDPELAWYALEIAHTHAVPTPRAWYA